MQKVTVKENQVGLQYTQGLLKGILKSGVYTIWNNKKTQIKVLEMKGLVPKEVELEIVLKQPLFQELVQKVEVGENQLGLIFENDRLVEVIKTGEYGLFTALHSYKVEIVDLGEMEVSKKYVKYSSNPKLVPYMTTYLVPEGMIGLLYLEGKLVHQLESGQYYFWNGAQKMRVAFVDLRQQQQEVNGQELMTQDRVSVRMNLVCQYKIVDPLQTQKVKDLPAQIYTRVQLMARNYIGGYKFDELIHQKEEIGQYILEQMKESFQNMGVELIEIGLKDIILPGDIKDIFNKVLIAEKQAQANVIMRREEVASTRSLLNTAKLMDENHTLYKLKELEYVERICENISQLTVTGNGSIIDLIKSLTEKTEKQ